MRLSPDGMNVTYVASTKGRGSIAYTLSLAKGSAPKPALSSDGKPLRLEGCHWVSNDRIVCLIYAVINDAAIGSVGMTRLVAVDADGRNPRVLSTRENHHTRGYQFGGGQVIDWLPDESGHQHSPERAGEMVEDYWMALSRDIPFSQYGAEPITAAAIGELDTLSHFKGPKVSGSITPGTLFRGV
jgi:hypothetical protein